MAKQAKHAHGVWSVAEAKAKFSEVIERAKADGPQRVTKNGRDAVVVVSAAEWSAKKWREGSLAEFFANSPLRGSGIDLERDRSTVRDIEF